MAATQSAAFSGDTYFISILASAEVYVAVGPNPTATTTIGENGVSRRILADTQTDIPVFPGWKVSCITSTGTSNVQVVEMTRDHAGNTNLPGVATVQLVSATT